MEVTGPMSYPYCDFDFASWNPVQRECYPHFTADSNLVVSASVASGKSAVAEAIFGYELSSSAEGKVVYASPLKALGRQKYAEWSRHDTFRRFPMLMSSSEDKASDADFIRSRLIVSTVESLNVQCRKRAGWLRDVRALVFDEAHLLGDPSRGAGAEAMLVNLTALNPGCRIICLSGTMPNCREVAGWLKGLNGKRTGFVISSWRPTKMEQDVRICRGTSEQAAEIERMVSGDVCGKTIVFVHSKRTGEELTRCLSSAGVACAFYHAGLRGALKERILSDFRSRMSGLDLIVATSSLSMGLNL